MITKEIVNNELYVWIYKKGMKNLLYKRWLNKGRGMIMCKQPFTAKDIKHE